ncbi:hypothetical protein IWX90DRAFT_30061 [Phyllosticta citrichinensis]|uniref:Uncharacterized protein n=1 Tax=Phyllosticta citrichinensis TaxID=1130410 RepID=A0ABR1Y7L3_9PEZI
MKTVQQTVVRTNSSFCCSPRFFRRLDGLLDRSRARARQLTAATVTRPVQVLHSPSFFAPLPRGPGWLHPRQQHSTARGRAVACGCRPAISSSSSTSSPKAAMRARARDVRCSFSPGRQAGSPTWTRPKALGSGRADEPVICLPWAAKDCKWSRRRGVIGTGGVDAWVARQSGWVSIGRDGSIRQPCILLASACRLSSSFGPDLVTVFCCFVEPCMFVHLRLCIDCPVLSF